MLAPMMFDVSDHDDATKLATNWDMGEWSFCCLYNNRTEFKQLK